MKQIKNLLLIFSLLIIPLFGISLADNCFDTVVGKDGKTLYIDPNSKYSVFENREKLISIYWNRLECSGNKKVYSYDEYMNLIFSNTNDNYGKEKSSQNTSVTIIEILSSVLGCIALWRIFNKAWKSWIGSIIPIYNLYEMSDIAWLSWLFKKAFFCLIIWIFVCFFVPILWMILVAVFIIYMYIVNYNIARNFWWSVISSVLYVIFNPIGILILAFWDYQYYTTKQKNNLYNKIMEKELENLVSQWIKDNEEKKNTLQSTLNVNTQTNGNNIQNEKVEIKYPDPNNINW